jgi:hypothetical protein
MKNPNAEINWPDKATLQEMLWAMPAKQIARKMGLSQSTVRMKAKELGLPIPPLGDWQRRGRINPSGPAGSTS